MDGEQLEPGSLVRRWRLGKQLRELREAAGKTMDEAAAYLGVKRPTISRIENGKQVILERNVRFLAQFYDIGAPTVDMLIRQANESNEKGWWTSYSDTVPDWFETYVGFESDADQIWKYESELVPGLFQTPEYTHGVTERRSVASVSERAQMIEFRMARQRRLETKKPRVRVVLNEAVLRRVAGPPESWVAQIRQLIEVARRPYVTLQVLPFSAGPHPAMKGPFSLLTLPEESAPNFVYLEHDYGALYLERPADLERYVRVFEQLVTAALSPAETISFLTSLASELSDLGKQEGHHDDARGDTDLA